MNRSDIPPDMLTAFMQHAANAYDWGKALQKEYLEGRKNLPRAIMLPAKRLRLQVARYQYKIRIRWYYRSVTGESFCLVRLACYATRSGRPFLTYNKQMDELHIGGSESDVAWIKGIELRTWNLINHAERVSEFFQEHKIPLRPEKG
jgi:hypothetical protein